ncbi:Nuclear pore complex protein [Nymphaea thermarum]|nr:Nuclear pore complex protein [Nymphaea thermarum]
MSRISTMPRKNSAVASSATRPSQVPTTAARQPVSVGHSGMELLPLSDKNILEKKASVYSDVVKNLNDTRERGLPFNTATAFKNAYEELNLESSGTKSVSMQKIWHLIQTLLGENAARPHEVSRRMSLVIGARRHLEWGHERYILDIIQSHPAQAALGGAVGNLQRVRAFLRIRLRDYGVLDFDASDARRQPPVDTTWQQIYFCLRTGYYDEARNIAQSSRASYQFASMLAQWIMSGGLVPPETSAAASEECEKMFRIGDRAGRSGYDKKKLLLYAMVSGCRRQVDRVLRDLPSLFTTIEDFLWFMLSAVRDDPSRVSSVPIDGLVPYKLEDLQVYLNKFEPSYYTKNGKDPLVYPYVLFLSIQLLPAVFYLFKEGGDEGYNVDAVHIAIALADHGAFSEDTGVRQKLGMLDAFAEVSSIIRQYGSLYLRQGNLPLALEYYAQAAAAVGGGRLSWVGRGNTDQQRQRNIMLRQLLTEILLRDGGIPFLLGTRGYGEEGELQRFFSDRVVQQKFLLEAARQCQEAGLYDKSVEIQKRVGAFGTALETINNIQERGLVSEQQLILRQLEAVVVIQKLARSGHHADALREISKLQFLPLDPRSPDTTTDVFQNLSPLVESCVPDLLKVALTCLDNVPDADGMVRILKAKISNFVANHMSRNWPQDLYDRVARSL